MVDHKSLLFQGSPDMIITTKIQRNEGSEGILNVTGAASDDDVATDGNSSPSSQESDRFQMDHQITQSHRSI